jgi:hypothetical protein
MQRLSVARASRGERFRANSGVIQRQHEPFDPPQIKNPIILLAIERGDLPAMMVGAVGRGANNLLRRCTSLERNRCLPVY